MSAAPSLKVPVKRAGLPLSLSPQLKPVVISLEEWEANAPLSEAEVRSISVIQRACEDKPLPSKV